MSWEAMVTDAVGAAVREVCAGAEALEAAKATSEAGLFFAQTVFGMLGAFLVVSKVTEWCVPVETREVRELVSEIDEELAKVRGSRTKLDDVLVESIVEHYQGCRDTAVGLQDKIEQAERGLVMGVYVAVALCEAIDIYLIESGVCRSLGAWGWVVLALLLPLPVARWQSQKRNKEARKATEQCVGDFRTKRARYARAYAGACDVGRVYEDQEGGAAGVLGELEKLGKLGKLVTPDGDE